MGDEDQVYLDQITTIMKQHVPDCQLEKKRGRNSDLNMHESNKELRTTQNGTIWSK